MAAVQFPDGARDEQAHFYRSIIFFDKEPKLKDTAKTIAAILIGIVIFFLLNRYVSIPSGIPETNINTAYAFLAFMAAAFGPIAGAVIGFVGHLLTDAVNLPSNGTIWWSWIIVSGFIGYAIGLCRRRINIEDKKVDIKDLLYFNLYQIAANIIGWGIFAPVLDILIYKEPADKVFLQGLTAAASNLITIAVLGSILLAIYAKIKSPEKKQTSN